MSPRATLDNAAQSKPTQVRGRSPPGTGNRDGQGNVLFNITSSLHGPPPKCGGQQSPPPPVQQGSSTPSLAPNTGQTPCRPASLQRDSVGRLPTPGSSYRTSPTSTDPITHCDPASATQSAPVKPQTWQNSHSLEAPSGGSKPLANYCYSPRQISSDTLPVKPTPSTNTSQDVQALLQALRVETDEKLTRFMNGVQEQLVIDRTDGLTNSVKLIEAAEERVTARISMEVCKLRSEFLYGKPGSDGKPGSESSKSTADTTPRTSEVREDPPHFVGNLTEQALNLDGLGNFLRQVHEEYEILRNDIMELKLKLDTSNHETRIASTEFEYADGSSVPVAYDASVIEHLQLSNWISDEVLKCVKSNECIGQMNEQYEGLKRNLQELLAKLDKQIENDFQTLSRKTAVTDELEVGGSAADLASLLEAVQECVKLHDSLGLELRHQRQQRNQDYGSLSGRLAEVENVLESCARDSTMVTSGGIF